MILLLLDQGLPRSLVSTLSEQGIDSIHVGNIGMATATDAEIIQKAIDLTATVVTLDSDFHSIRPESSGTCDIIARDNTAGQTRNIRRFCNYDYKKWNKSSSFTFVKGNLLLVLMSTILLELFKTKQL